MSDITQAVGAPLQRHVMPCAEVPVHPRQGRLWANVRPIGAETSVPSYPLDDLYDQAALDAAVAAERERSDADCHGNSALLFAAPRMLVALDALIAGDKEQCLDDDLFEEARAAVALARAA